MIERHITFNVHPDRTEAFERFFADAYAPHDGQGARASSGSSSFARSTARRATRCPFALRTPRAPRLADVARSTRRSSRR